MSTATKEELHRLVDALPETEVAVARRVLEALGTIAADAVMYSLKDAPIDDEPTTPEEDASSAEAWAEYRRGEALSAEEAKRLLSHSPLIHPVDAVTGKERRERFGDR